MDMASSRTTVPSPQGGAHGGGRLRLHHSTGPVGDHGGEWTLREALDAYVLGLRKAGRVSTRNTEWAADALCKAAPTVASTRVSEITNRDVEVVRRAYADRKPATQKHALALMKRALLEASRQERGDHKPGLSFKAAKGSGKLRYLSKAEFEAYLECLGPPLDPEGLRLIALGLVFTGMRYSELLGVRWADVCWSTVEGGDDTIKVWGNKTEKERIVPLTTRLALLLRAAQAQGAPSPFPPRMTRMGDRSPRAMARRLNAAFDQAGLNPPENVRRYGKATVHSLRHTYASWLLQGGATLDEVSKMLGHSSIVMTQRYAHLSVGNTVNKVGQLLNNL